MPSLILLDLIMPGMDGRTFLAQRDANAGRSSIPVVLVSCQVDAPITATKLGIAGTIRKPIGIRNLVEAMHGHAS
jgi:CheY-like chemotaxis protein